MVFYFTGTGNSLYVAKQFDPKPISIGQVMRNKNENFLQTALVLSRLSMDTSCRLWSRNF